MEDTVLEQPTYLEERKFQYLLEMHQKTMNKELEKFKEQISSLQQVAKSLQNDVNSLKSQQPANAIAMEDALIAKTEESVQNETKHPVTTNDNSHSTTEPKQNSQSSADLDDVSIEKFFYCGKK